MEARKLSHLSAPNKTLAFCARSLVVPCSDQPTGRLALVFELMECNIYELIKGRTTYLKVTVFLRRQLRVSLSGTYFEL